MDVTEDTVTADVLVEDYTALRNDGVRVTGTFTPNEGTVTSVATGAGLTGGTITTSGTIKADLVSETKLTGAATAATETSGRVYPVALDKDGKLAVNVPWTDTTYTAATATPLMDGTGAVGSSSKYAKEDHVHPSDTSRVPTTRTVNSKALSSDITLAASDVGAVPTTRTVNSKALSSDITLAASDVGAVPTTRTVNSKALSSDITLTASDVSAIASSLKGAASGVAELDSNGKVPTSQLPSYVDDVLEYAAKSSFPSTGETGKIYVDTSTNLTYRWSGTAYVEISPSLALGTTSSTAYRGDYGNTAYSHATDSSRLTTAQTSGLYKIAVSAEGHVASVTAVAKSDITGLGIPGSDTNTTYTASTTSIGSASTGTEISADDITDWDSGSVPSLTITSTDCDDITGWTANTATSASVASGIFKITTGTSASLSYTSKSVGSASDWSAGSIPSLSYTSKSIPNISVTSTTVVTGITEDS